MPQITHRDLVAFADSKVNLKKTEVDDQRAQVNRLRDRIESKIAASPGYGFVKALHTGSVAKGTALRSVNDRDLAVYVKAEKAPDGTPELVNWVRDRLIDAYPAMREDQIVASTNCVNVRFAGTGLDVDVVPVLYQGEPNGLGDAAELAEILQFFCDWLAAEHGGLGASLQRYVGRPACGITQLRADLDRFTFLLGGSDGEPLFELYQ